MDRRIINLPLVLTGAFTMVAPTAVLFFSLNVLYPLPLLVGLMTLFVGMRKAQPTVHRRAMLIGFIACLLASLGPLFAAAYGNGSGRPIRVILSPGFVGEFSIVKDGKRGVTIEPTEGVWVYRIPESGILFVRENAPFFRWHPPIQFVDARGSTVVVEPLETTAGSRPAGPGASSSSTDFDGTTHRWRALAK